MRTVAIIQARTDSTRLPNKTLVHILDHPILHWVIHRTRTIPNIDQIVLATTNRPTDQPLTQLAYSEHIASISTPTVDDVLDRYYVAARVTQADRILRITADSPLLDPVLCTDALHALDTGADYACAVGWPAGLAQEAFTRDALERAHREATDPYDREHVVTHMLRDSSYQIRFIANPHPVAGSYCVDTQADLDRLRHLAQLEPRLFDLDAATIIGLDQKAAA